LNTQKKLLRKLASGSFIDLKLCLPVSKMVSTDVHLNFHLKREILLLASEISAASPRNTLGTEEYIITREELRGIDISDQNVVLKRHLDILREIRSTGQPPESSLSSSPMHGDVT
jgi:hypothetical protein